MVPLRYHHITDHLWHQQAPELNGREAEEPGAAEAAGAGETAGGAEAQGEGGGGPTQGGWEVHTHLKTWDLTLRKIVVVVC